MKQRPPHGIPLNVLPSEPKITMVDDPAAYDINKQDAQQYYRQDEPQYDQQYDQQDGFARQNSGSVHGYAVHHNTRYDDEPLVSDMRLQHCATWIRLEYICTCFNLAICMRQLRP